MLLIVLCNSSANSLFKIFLFLIAAAKVSDHERVAEDFLSKNL